MYADDTVVLAESEVERQRSLSTFNEYCKEWQLNINVMKPKIILF